MLKHLFKMIWNKKKQNFLLMTEILISFMVIFAVFTLMLYYYNNYKKPLGMVAEDLWVINYNNPYKTNNSDSLATYYETLKNTLKALPQVKGLSFSGDNVPFANSVNQGATSYKGKQANNVNQYRVDDNYKPVLNMQLLGGRWFNKGDAVAKDRPVVINDELAAELFGNTDPVGKLLGDREDKNKMKIIGVVQGVKAKGDYLTAGSSVYYRIDTGAYHWLGRLFVKTTPNADAAFEGRLYKTMANFMKNSDIEIEHMDAKRTNVNYFNVVPAIVLGIVSLFLIINVALGLFGVLWYNINKRRGEIGLRRAVGATGNSVSAQLVSESMLLATLSLIIGAFFAVQFPLLNVFNLQAGIYLGALLLAVVFIYLLVFVCSLYPGRQAAAIYPAVALHED